jgi:hypothetical protein
MPTWSGMWEEDEEGGKRIECERGGQGDPSGNRVDLISGLCAGIRISFLLSDAFSPLPPART